MIDEQSSASGHDYASDRSAIGAGDVSVGDLRLVELAIFDVYVNCCIKSTLKEV